MVFTKLLLENALAIRPCNYGAASESHLPKVARCIPVFSSRYVEKCAAHVLKRSGLESLLINSPIGKGRYINTERQNRMCERGIGMNYITFQSAIMLF